MNNAQNDIGITIMCLYVTLRYCVKRAKPIVKKFLSPSFLTVKPPQSTAPADARSVCDSWRSCKLWLLSQKKLIWLHCGVFDYGSMIGVNRTSTSANKPRDDLFLFKIRRFNFIRQPTSWSAVF